MRAELPGTSSRHHPELEKDRNIPILAFEAHFSEPWGSPGVEGQKPHSSQSSGDCSVILSALVDVRRCGLSSEAPGGLHRCSLVGKPMAPGVMSG